MGGGYVFAAGRPFYRVAGKNAVIKPVDESVQPPDVAIDSDALSAMARAAGITPPETIGNSTGAIYRRNLAYVVCVNEAGEIVAVQRMFGKGVPEIEAALRQARVLSPGRREGRIVPTALFVPVS